jgi:hypothetical protein
MDELMDQDRIIMNKEIKKRKKQKKKEYEKNVKPLLGILE